MLYLGHFYFARIGHYHFAVTFKIPLHQGSILCFLSPCFLNLSSNGLRLQNPDMSFQIHPLIERLSLLENTTKRQALRKTGLLENDSTHPSCQIIWYQRFLPHCLIPFYLFPSHGDYPWICNILIHYHLQARSG